MGKGVKRTGKWMGRGGEIRVREGQIEWRKRKGAILVDG